METVGIRELKANLSRYLERVRLGARLLITDRGRPIATITAVAEAADVDWAHQIVAEGSATWSGGKPTGANKPAKLKRRRTASSVILEDRR